MQQLFGGDFGLEVKFESIDSEVYQMQAAISEENHDLEQQPVCVVCGEGRLFILAEVRGMPIHTHLLRASYQEALMATRGDLRLVWCDRCGHIFNCNIKPQKMDYAGDYENSLHFSPMFRAYAQEMALQLVDRYGLYGKNIIEIGAGRGEFLAILCEAGSNRGFGLDPNYTPDPEQPLHPSVTMFPDVFSEAYAHLPSDFICCRHVLEHLPKPVDFLKMVRNIVGDHTNTRLFFEAPDVRYILQKGGVWDIIYEYCSYFSPASLSRAFRRAGFEIENLSSTFQGQYLTIELRPAAAEGGSKGQPEWESFTEAFYALMKPDLQVEEEAWMVLPQEMAASVMAFAGVYRRKVMEWRSRLELMDETGVRALVWGAGSKGATFLNLVDKENLTRFIVDINPRKTGLYVPGSGQKIVLPGFLKTYRPHFVIIMNPNYEGEIWRALRELDLDVGILVA